MDNQSPSILLTGWRQGSLPPLPLLLHHNASQCVTMRHNALQYNTMRHNASDLGKARLIIFVDMNQYFEKQCPATCTSRAVSGWPLPLPQPHFLSLPLHGALPQMLRLVSFGKTRIYLAASSRVLPCWATTLQYFLSSPRTLFPTPSSLSPPSQTPLRRWSLLFSLSMWYFF